jgi:NAD+ kinase
MKTLGVIINRDKQDVPETAAQIAQQVRASGGVLLGCEQDVAIPGIDAVSLEELFARSEAVISLGGDGTMLHAVQLMGDADVPIIGFNMGTLGFMTSVPRDGIRAAVEKLMAGEGKITERTRIKVKVFEDGEVKAAYRALNDVAVGWGASSRIITLDMSIDGESVTSYACDGLIISTPTGSTGHSLSAGGPILHPATQVFVVSPICPHTLSSRPLVVNDQSVIRVEVMKTSRELRLAADGQEHCCVVSGNVLEVTRSRRNVRFIHFEGYSYYDVLRRKLRWRGSSV